VIYSKLIVCSKLFIVNSYLITTGGRIEEFDEFCYLGNVLDCEAGLERAVRASLVEKMEGDDKFDIKQKYSI